MNVEYVANDGEIAMIIRREDHITYANIPFPYLEKLKPIFSAQGFEYEILFGFDIPADQPQCVYIEGMKAFSGVCCVKSYMNPDDIHRLMLSVWNPKKYGSVDGI